MRTGIYAVFDLAAEEVIGGLHLHKHDASAIRMFSDGATAKGSILEKHPEDFDLLFLGTLDLDEDDCVPGIDREVRARRVLTGKQWAAIHLEAKANA